MSERAFLDSADTLDEAWEKAAEYAEKLRAFNIHGRLISVREIITTRPHHFAIEVVSRKDPVVPDQREPPDDSA
jgi:hypothetical protein